MTFSSFAGVALTLALVLGLVAVTMRVLRRVAQGGGGSAGRGRVPLEVVQRIALGPRQGIAVVRIGGQLVAVSVGEGGVRAIAELDADDAAALQPDVTGSAAPYAAPSGKGQSFAAALRHGLRSAGIPLGIALLALAPMVPRPAHAQAAGENPPAAQAQRPAADSAARSRPATAPSPRPAATAQAQTARQTPATAPATPAASGAPAVASLDAVTRALPQIDLKLNDDKNGGGLRLSGTVGVVVMMGALTLLPALLLLMTSFTRILIVLHFLKQALGTQTAPPAQLITALALLLTGFVMTPTLSEVNRTALTPWMNGQMEQGQMMSTALVPLREFMLRQTRERDIAAFVEMSAAEPPKTVEETPTIVLMSAFVTSELRTAFQLGFVLFLPFIIIDIVVSSVLMSMGMFMLPPAMISLPFKLLLFVLVDGWALLVQSLVAGFR